MRCCCHCARFRGSNSAPSMRRCPRDQWTSSCRPTASPQRLPRRRRTGIAEVEALVASAIGLLTAVGGYLMLRRTTFPVVIGLSFLSYATNLYLLTMGRLVIDRPPICSAGAASYTVPLPAALVLTAIVISFGMTALIVVIALWSFLETGSDRADLGPGAAQSSDRHHGRVQPAERV